MIHWLEGLIFLSVFSVVVGAPCIAIGIIGTRMINELGNFPSKAASIQLSAIWKVAVVELVAFTLLAGFLLVFDPR